MEGALGWIGDLIELFISFIPHLGLCRANHGGVKYVHGKKVVVIRPGLFWYWPIVTEHELTPTARQTLNPESQTLTTKDNKTVLLSAVVIYSIDDVKKAIVDTYDIEETMADIALHAAMVVVDGRTFTELRNELTDQVCKELTRQCRKDLKPFGIRVEKAYLSDFAKTEVYRIVGALPAADDS